MTKTILCYGDSNTWGAIPGNYRQRYDASIRWPTVLGQILGEKTTIIEEGLSGRTTVVDDAFEEGRNGKTYLLPCLRSHRPLDVVILMLGTNDLKARFYFGAYDIGRGMALLATMIQQSACGPAGGSPQVLLVCPPPIGPLGSYAAEMTGGEAKSLALAEYYRQHAAALNCHFIDAGRVITSSPIDGVHFDAASHRRLAEVLAEYLTAQLLG
jgi:lysophospholipase L1-like esterase